MILTGPAIRGAVWSGKQLHGQTKTAVATKENVGQYDSMDYIHVDPYDPNLVGPNSVDLRLGNKLLVYENVVKRFRNSGSPESPVYAEGGSQPLDMREENPAFELEIPEDGFILRPGILYLGRTIECIGSNKYVPIVEGRSSVGRLGIHIHVTAGFCDLGFKGTITLEIHCIHPVRIYPNVPICQAYFLRPEGDIELYQGRYQGQEEPTASRFSREKGQ